MSTEFDLIIVGGGLVGAALAAALEPACLSVALIEPDAPRAIPADQSIDQRVYAVSPGSAAFLESCGAWEAVSAERVTTVERMQIYGDDAAARLDFDAYDAGLRELAFIAENRLLHRALWQRLDTAAHVRRYCPARCTAMHVGRDDVALTLEGGETIVARLVVGADGADSWVREAAGIEAVTRAYGERGVVANFETERPHEGTAFQWFRRDGVLALLPLPGNRASMVWSTPDVHAEALLAADVDAFAEEVQEASRHALGTLKRISGAAAFPLKLQRVSRLIAPRVALIGDAAHSIHPLAGQGVNLGLRDARELGRVLADRGLETDCGDYGLLRRYERARKEDIAALQFVTDGLQQLFAANAVWVGRARNFGLRLVNAQAMIKTRLVRQAVA
jgi:ubiquinone biosynthesis UbiH/UbiF/VisC/COQ6 family hydroxylase